MNKTRFRVIISIAFLTSFIGGFWDFIFDSEDIELVEIYADMVEARGSQGLEFWSFIISVLASVFTILAYIGLFFFKNVARYLFLFSFLLIAPLVPFLGIYVSSGLERLIVDISNMMVGAVFAIIFWKPNRDYFT